MANRKSKTYFREKTQINNADGTVVSGNRFLDKDKPTEQTFKELFDSIAFILNKEDTASPSFQGLVKTVTGDNAKNGLSPSDGFTYAAQVKNLPIIKDKIQTIKTLTGKLVTASTSQTSSDRNEYTLELSSSFIDFLSTELTTLQTNINNVSLGVPDLSALQADITSIQGSLTNLTSSNAAIASSLSSNNLTLAANSASISTNTSNIATNTAAIATLNPADNRFLGEMITLPANSAPSANWLLCDGGAISRTTYSALFTLIGTSYGVGDGSTSFNVPDLAGKVQRGYKVGDASFGLGSTGGNDAITLAVNNLPAHTHGINITTNVALATTSSDGTTLATARSGDVAGTAIDSSIEVQVLGDTAVNVTTADPISVKDSYLTLFYFIKATA